MVSEGFRGVQISENEHSDNAFVRDATRHLGNLDAPADFELGCSFWGDPDSENRSPASSGSYESFRKGI